MSSALISSPPTATATGLSGPVMLPDPDEYFEVRFESIDGLDAIHGIYKSRHIMFAWRRRFTPRCNSLGTIVGIGTKCQRAHTMIA